MSSKEGGKDALSQHSGIFVDGLLVSFLIAGNSASHVDLFPSS